MFYYLYDGLESDGRLSEFHLDPDLRRRHALLAGDRYDMETKSLNVDRFCQLKGAFKLLGFRPEDTNTVYRILAAVLHLGDVQFAESPCDNGDSGSRVIDQAPLHRGEFTVVQQHPPSASPCPCFPRPSLPLRSGI